jgi:hypothetical protein
MPNVDPAQFPSRIEIFRAGRHVDASGRELNFTAADIAQIAASYNPELSEAPIVVGHPTLNGPAYGWTKALHADGDRLLAEPHQVEAQFAELHAEGRFKKKSASLFHPDSPGNPTPGKWYLRHIGFLGAQPPAVKGLRDAQFAAPADAIVAEFSSPIDTTRWALGTIRRMFSRFRDYLVEKEGAERAQAVISDFELEQLGNDVAALNAGDALNPMPAFSEPPAAAAAASQETSMPDANFAEREAALAAREAAVAESERQARELAAAAARTEAVSFAEGLIKAGRLKPARKDAVVELLLSQPATTIDFAESDGGPKAPGALLRELLAEAPAVINFNERSAPSGAAAANVDFAAPAGTHLSADRLELHRKALAYQAAHPNTPYLTAVAAVGG